MVERDVAKGVANFSAAFDIIGHNLCLKTTCVVVFQPLPYCVFKAIYRSNRTLLDFFNVKHVKCGVPQGSSLGPLVCSIFTNALNTMHASLS